MQTQIVYDFQNGFRLPQEMVALPHQLQGSALSNLSEFAARSCYDSLGAEKSRPTLEYHQNILESKHLSVYEHCNMIFQWKFIDIKSLYEHAAVLLNRPGIYTRFSEDQKCFWTTINSRSALEWDTWSAPTLLGMTDIKSKMGKVLNYEFYKVMPEVFGKAERPDTNLDFNWAVSRPETLDEYWVSFWITGYSRNCSMELIRHGDWTAISQRSTRYCDESESPVIHHPLIEKYGLDVDAPVMQESIRMSKKLYNWVFCTLQEKQIQNGVDKSTAKKQARGAARQYLEGGTETKFVFSASLAQWQHIIEMRSHPSADEEIQHLAKSVNKELVELYPQWFSPI